MMRSTADFDTPKDRVGTLAPQCGDQLDRTATSHRKIASSAGEAVGQPVCLFRTTDVGIAVHHVSQRLREGRPQGPEDVRADSDDTPAGRDIRPELDRPRTQRAVVLRVATPQLGCFRGGVDASVNGVYVQ